MSNEIVKKIEGPSVDDEYFFEEEDTTNVQEEVPKKSKSMLGVLLGIIFIGAAGYYGFTTLKNSTIDKSLVVTETKPTEESPKEPSKQEIEKKSIPTVVTEKVVKTDVEKKEVKKKKSTESTPTRYVEELAILTKDINGIVNKEEPALEKKLAKADYKPLPAVKKVVAKKAIVKKVVLKKPKKIVQKVFYEKVKPRIIHVKKGDTLAVLAKRYYGNVMAFKSIVRANRRLKSSKTSLRLGEKLIIPRKSKRKTRRYIIVQKGNTLALLAKRFYGNIHKTSKIVRANYKIKSKRSLLHLGQKVYVPR